MDWLSVLITVLIIGGAVYITIFDNLFCKQLDKYQDDYQTAAAAFLLGVRQGLYTAYGVESAVIDECEKFGNVSEFEKDCLQENLSMINR
ncbi:MAG: hypothetical protein ACI38A_07330 [Candidatus Ornithomonoglobus sp.]